MSAFLTLGDDETLERLERVATMECRKQKPKRPSHPAWKRQAAIDGYRAGEKILALAIELELDPDYISKLAARAGLPRRKQGPPSNRPLARKWRTQ